LMILGKLPRIAYVTSSSATTCTSNTGVTDTAREKALDAINQNRRTAVNGQLQNGNTAGTNLPHGKNMYKLDWDCGLEGLAEVLLSNDCSAPTTTLPNNGIGSAVVANPATMDDIFTNGIASWPAVLTGSALNQPAPGASVTYDGPPPQGGGNPTAPDATLVPIANMIQGKTTKVGCSARKCTTDGLLGDTIYEAGNGVCQSSTAAQDCTTYPPPTCDINTGLCVVTDATTTATATTTAAAATTAASSTSVVYPTGGTNSRCTQNTGMTDELRYLFRDMHNYRRSQTALGKTVKNTGRYLPSSSNMQYMRYNCPMEATAIQLAATCPTPSTQAGRLIGQVPIGTYTFTTATQEVGEELIYIVKSWWRVVRQVSGPGMKVTFKAQHVGTPIASFTQMAWAASRRLGCAVVRCPTVYTAVCNYNPSGNVVGQQIYTPGTPCTACAAGSTCNPSQALCTLP
uniref:SCP domain-containing protein n=1 Tax=Heligmosomoides polygyrus TaxID=6339 RepID=A0A8L8JQ17_HELPZ